MATFAQTQFVHTLISNPKLHTDKVPKNAARLFPYYAGYASQFADTLLSSLQLPNDSIVFDPWNGSGTTTHAAARLGLRSRGQDLNPVMIVVARAGMANAEHVDQVVNTPFEIFEQIACDIIDTEEGDPLTKWFVPSSAVIVRAIERKIIERFVNTEHRILTGSIDLVSSIDSTASLYYVALFRAVRGLLDKFVPSNPTWVKEPKSSANRLRPNRRKILTAFAEAITEITSVVRKGGLSAQHGDYELALASSESSPMEDSSIDFVLTSPPYCTRIDYAIATSIELAVLNIKHTAFDSLRRSLMGTSTVPKNPIGERISLGATADAFLKNLSQHPSKASSTYYLKNHLQYFHSLQRSISELGRVSKVGAGIVLVIQDSFYKDVHNDVPQIAIELAESSGLSLARIESFTCGSSMVGLNKKSKAYVTARVNYEKVLCFINRK